VAPDTVWEIVFLMVILKIPLVYLCLVVWWAIKAEPRPPEPATLVRAGEPDPSGPARPRPVRRGPPRPHRGPTRTYPRTPRTAVARKRAER
jgi:hypothetical protein